MKKLLSILFILALLMISVPALAQGTTVTADGSGSVTLVPDMATFSVGITTQDAMITTAQSGNAAAMQAVVDALTALGVARQDIQTEYFSVSPVTDYSGATPTVMGYTVSNSVTVIVRDLAALPTLLDGTVAAGANNVYGLNFQSSEQNAAYDQALKAAVQDALRKAALMAQAVGMEAGDPVSLTENSSMGTTVNFKAAAYAMDSAATPIENGTLTVTAQVTAVVEIK